MPADIEQSIASNTLRPDAKEPRPPEELYDLVEDPWEESNLIDAPELEFGQILMKDVILHAT